MENIFLHLVNMSITAGWIALAVMILRLFLKKAPKWITVLLWGLVGLRLILPVSIESVLSLIPSAETIPPEIVYAQEPQIHSGIEVFNSAVNPVISESLAPSGELTSINPVQVLLAIATVVWIAGVAGMLVYTLISYLR
ncbi:MAG: peptidase M56, partial [Ruminococcus sp.]|nr:peptidase M56 [Ruminococcus sp.]